MILDVAEHLLSNENEEYTSKAAETYGDSQSIKEIVKHIRQCQFSKTEKEVERLRRELAKMQKEHRELKQKLSEDSMEWRAVQSEEEKERVKLGLNHKQQTTTAGISRAQILLAPPTIKELNVLQEPGGQKVKIVSSIAGKWKEVGFSIGL